MEPLLKLSAMSLSLNKQQLNKKSINNYVDRIKLYLIS